MSLEISHGCWSGGYGEYNNFKHRIARAVGIPLYLMDGYLHEKDTEIVSHYKEFYRDICDVDIFTTFPIKWGWCDNPIRILLNRPDCDGTIEWLDQIPLAESLESIANLLPSENLTYGFDIQQRAMQFAKGLRLAHSLGESIQFSYGYIFDNAQQ